MPAGFEFEDRDKIRRVNQRFVLGPLGCVENPFVRPLAKHFDPRLHRRIDTEGNKTSSRFRVEAEAQRFQKAVKPGCRIHVFTVTQMSGFAVSKSGLSARERRLEAPSIAEIGPHPATVA